MKTLQLASDHIFLILLKRLDYQIHINYSVGCFLSSATSGVVFKEGDKYGYDKRRIQNLMYIDKCNAI